MLIFHSVSDEILPFAGGHIADTTEAYPHQRPADQVAADWAQFKGCSVKPLLEVLPHHYLRYSWTDCRAPVVFYVVPSGSHDWPGDTFYKTGGANLDLSATDTIWTFFEHARR